jgi:biopolymer transport protein ExbD
MAMKVSRPKELEDAEVIIIPMIDTMMFLLMVFIVASLTLAVQQGLPVNLPKASTSTQHQADNVTLTVTAAQQIYVNTALTPLAGESAELSKLKVGEGTMIIMNIDKAVPYGTLIAVMDNARKAGAARFVFGTSAQT